MIKMDETIRAIFFVQVSETSNWMGAINEGPNGTIEYMWRMRHGPIDPAKPDDWHNAEKNWYHGVAKMGLDGAFERIRLMLTLLDPLAIGRPHELIRGAMTLEEFALELSRQPWVSATVLPEGGQA